MVVTYFHLGKLIVEQEQKGSTKATYGEEVIKQLSDAIIEITLPADQQNIFAKLTDYTCLPKQPNARFNSLYSHIFVNFLTDLSIMAQLAYFRFSHVV